jgi:hypothetical protein
MHVFLKQKFGDSGKRPYLCAIHFYYFPINPMKQLTSLTLIVITALLCACSSMQGDEARRRQAVAQQRLARLQEESRLVFVEYTLREICGSKDQTVWRILGDKEVLYSLTAHVTAGMETSKIQPDALAIARDSTVVLTLPHCQVFDVDIPNSEVRHVYERITGISSDLTAAERNAVLAEGEKQVKLTIKKLGIIPQAEAKAEVFFRSMLSQAGYNPSRCKIVFE